MTPIFAQLLGFVKNCRFAPGDVTLGIAGLMVLGSLVMSI